MSSSKLCKLTPLKAAIALAIEFKLLSESKAIFEKRVFDAFRLMPVSFGKYDLNIPELVLDFIDICLDFTQDEFEKATFNSLYGMRVDKAAFDRNFHLNGFEANLLVDDANLTQLLKVWFFLMNEMFYRFFYSYNPQGANSSKAYYTVLGDSKKTQRTSQRFFEFLECLKPIITQLCMISPERTEIREIFSSASAEAKAAIEATRCSRLKTANIKTSPKSSISKSATQSTHAAPALAEKKSITLSERLRKLDSNLKMIQEGILGKVIEIAPAPPSVWKKSSSIMAALAAPATLAIVATPAIVAAPAILESESDYESDSDFAAAMAITSKGNAKAKPTPKPKKPKAAAASKPATTLDESDDGFTVVCSKPKQTTSEITVQHAKATNGRSHRIFSLKN